eukprot:GHVU01192553.1.p3 GENE.GHVU01192553.1~~GHVU01192553.1.p3  ORF type:complete len:111 (+),score=5.18 GHVU01192553.1:1777-2109(+)
MNDRSIDTSTDRTTTTIRLSVLSAGIAGSRYDIHAYRPVGLTAARLTGCGNTLHSRILLSRAFASQPAEQAGDRQSGNASTQLVQQVTPRADADPLSRWFRRSVRRCAAI